MKFFISIILALTFLIAGTPVLRAGSGELSGSMSVEQRLFIEDASFPGQKDFFTSLRFQPEYYYQWNENAQNITFAPYLLLDQHDKERTHFDIRELYWLTASDNWELSVGARKIFWGVTESRHLVDIINQTDLVENLDEEDKLGQPMVKLSMIQDWGIFDIYYLPVFRERTFPGRKGRLRFGKIIDQDSPVFESSAENYRPSWALRYSHNFGPFDIGLSYFTGVNREPRLVDGVNKYGDAVLVPHYDNIDQGSLDLQMTMDSWLWKLEMLARGGSGNHYSAMVGGFEYTFFGIFDTPVDVGILSEYLFDERGDKSPVSFDNDLFSGVRIVANDTQSSELLVGATVDLETQTTLFSLEGSRRIGENWKLDIEVRLFNDVSDTDPYANLKDDDFLQAELSYYF